MYVDSIMQIHKVVSTLTSLLIQADCLKTSAINAIQAYHSELAKSDKRHIFTEFEMPDIESILSSSMYRIIVTTNAMGMSINNPDI